MWSLTRYGHNSPGVVTQLGLVTTHKMLSLTIVLEYWQKDPQTPPPLHTHTHSLSEHDNGLRFTYARSSLPPESGAVVVALVGAAVVGAAVAGAAVVGAAVAGAAVVGAAVVVGASVTVVFDSTPAIKNIPVIVIITIIILFFLPSIYFILE